MEYVSGKLESEEKVRLKLLCRMKGLSVSKFVAKSVEERMSNEINDVGKEKFDILAENFMAERKMENMPELSNIIITDISKMKKSGKKEMFGNPKDIQELVGDEYE